MEKKDLLSKLEELKKAINNLKSNLNKSDGEKESWFRKKESLKKDISKFVKELKDIKHNKDVSNVEIKKLREERDSYNKKVRGLISKIKELNKSKLEFIKSHKIKGNPEIIKKKIEDLEFKIETEVLSMNKEKEIMKEIKSLKKIYEENIGLKNIMDEINKVDEEINEDRNKSDEIHKKIRENFNINDPGYIKFKEYSSKINNIRKEQQAAFDNFIKFKNKFLKVNEELQGKLKESGEINKRLDEINNQVKLEKEKRKELELNEREKLVEEKLLTKKKLTKDDLIMLQR